MSRSSSVRGCMSFHAGRSPKTTTPTVGLFIITVTLQKNLVLLMPLVNTSVSYITFKKRVSQLSKVDWFINADLKNGYRQLPVHTADWNSLGPNEFYIDIAMPFGKANSSRVFCTWTTAWCESFKVHFQNQYSTK